MSLTRFAIARRVTIAMFVGILVVLGLLGLERMPWDLFPSIDVPVVVVSVPYPGAGPDEIEQRVVKPLEDALSVIEGVDYLESSAQENMGAVVVHFLNDVDTDVAAADVRDALGQVRGVFPDDTGEPVVSKFDPSSIPIIVVGVTGDRDPRDLRKLVEDEVKPALGRVRGVAAVSVSGGEEREIQILASQERLMAVGLTANRLSQLLAAENIDLPAGTIKTGGRDFRVRVLGQIKDLEDLRGLMIDTPAAGPVRLDQIADVEDTVVEPDAYTRINGTPSVALQVMKQSTANTVSVAEGVRAQVEWLRRELPSDLEFTITQDHSEAVIEAVIDLRNAIAYGAIFAALVVFLFLHSVRATIIVAIAIPTSIIASFFPVSMGFGFTLNMMVMLGLALSVGVLVDDAVVVLENIQRHLKRGELPAQAALNGRTEIGAAAVAITTVDIVVYVPIALMQGIIGQVFYGFAITVVVCVLFSLGMAFTVTPMLAAWWYERETRAQAHAGRSTLMGRFIGAWDRGYKALQRAYTAVLRRAIRHPYITLALAYGALILVFGVFGSRLRNEFFPNTDERQVNIRVEMPVGTRLEVTDDMVRAIEARLADREKYPEIVDVFAQSGSQGTAFLGLGKSGPNYGHLSLFLRPARERKLNRLRTDQQLAESLRRDLADLPSTTLFISAGSSMGGPGGGMELVLSGEDYDTLLSEAARLRTRIAQIEGIRDVELSTEAGRPEVQIEIDRWRARDYDLTTAEIAMAVRRAIAGGTDSKYRVGGDEYDIRVQLPRAELDCVERIEGLLVGRTKSGRLVRVRDVATVTPGFGPTVIERYQRTRSVTITAQNPGIGSADARDAIEAVLNESRNGQVHWAWTGSTKWQTESMNEMRRAILLAVVLIYMVTAALYNSVLEPLNIMLILPLALVGGIVGLYVTGMSMSLVAMIGMIMLMGIVGKNAILVVDYTNTLRVRGRERMEALIEAGTTRMQPVLMTTTAASLAMVPTALALAEGSEWRAPMAVVVIFGLILATPASLIVVPASYVIWDQVGQWFRRIGLAIFVRGRRSGDATAPEEGDGRE